MGRATRRRWSVGEAEPCPAASPCSRPLAPTEPADAVTQGEAGSPASEELQTLLALLAHDIRSPLHTLGLSCELLASRIDTSDASAARQLEIMRYTIRQIDRLVDDVLTMAALRHREGVPELKGCSVRHVLQEAVADHRALAEANGITLVLHMPDTECEALIHRPSLLRVLSNLLSNAIRFTPDGRVDVLAEQFDNELRVVVRDTGQGIAPERLKDVFRNASLHDDDQGRSGGMGLYIVRSILDAYGGSVSAESSVGRGSSFTFVLPLSPSRENARGINDEHHTAASRIAR
jgi:signal transduction histidine kinase